MNESNGKDPHSLLRNHVAIVLDESGSMMSMRREAMDAFNEQVESIRASAADQPTTVSLIKFNTSVPDPAYWAQPVAAMQPLTEKAYEPNGLTAMLDAVGLTIDRLRALPDAEDEDTSFLVLIISDGQENNSKKFSHADIAERIQQLDKTNRWTFAYMGANQDLAAVTNDLHIPSNNVADFVATPGGMMEGAKMARERTEAWSQKRRSGQKSDKEFFRSPSPEPPVEPGTFWGDGSR